MSAKRNSCHNILIGQLDDLLIHYDRYLIMHVCTLIESMNHVRKIKKQRVESMVKKHECKIKYLLNVNCTTY